MYIIDVIILMEAFMKKISVFLILVLLIFSTAVVFAGGNKETTEVEKETMMSDDGPKTPIQIYNSGFVFPEEKIELDYWHVLESREGYHELVQGFAKAYSKIHPNVTINIRSIPNGQQRAVWTTAFQSGSAPDIAWIETQLGLLNKGMVEAPAWAVKMMEETFTPYALSLSKVDGTSYGWSGAEVDVGQMLYYRKDLFREAGLDPEKPPTTIEEMLEYAKKLTKYDENGEIVQAGIALRYAGGPQGIGDKFSKYAAAYMDTSKNFYYTEDYSAPNFDNQGWADAAQFYQDLVFKYKVSSTVMPIPITAFGQGLAAMTNRESFFAGWLDENFPGTEFGIAPLVNGSSETGAMPWLALVGVSVDSKYPDVAWDFAMYMAQAEQEIAMVKNNGGMSRLKAFQDDPYFKTLPYYDVFNAMTENRPLVRNPYLDPNTLQAELETKVGEVAVEVITNKNADAVELFADLQDYAVKRLEEITK
jgi:multiple sugar transport system substrate-binding protein